MHKLKNNRGETLIEVIAAILIATLSAALLFSFVIVSTKMDLDVKGVDENHYEAITAANTHDINNLLTPTGTTQSARIRLYDAMLDEASWADTEVEIVTYGHTDADGLSDSDLISYMGVQAP